MERRLVQSTRGGSDEFKFPGEVVASAIVIGVKELIFAGKAGTGHILVGTKESFGGAHAEETVDNIHIFKAVRSTCIGHVSVPGTEVSELFGTGHKDVFACIGTGSRHKGEDLIDISPVVGSENGVAFVTGILGLRHGEVVVGRGGRCRFTFSCCHRGGDGVALQSELLSDAKFSKPCTLCLGEGSVEGCSGSGAGSLSAGSVIQCVLRFGDGCGQRHAERAEFHIDFPCSQEVVHQRLKVGLESGGIVDGCLKFMTRNIGAEQPARSSITKTINYHRIFCGSFILKIVQMQQIGSMTGKMETCHIFYCSYIRSTGLQIKIFS